MSELKVWTAQEIANSEKKFLMPPIKVYLKSEVDKCIDLLKAKANYNEYAYKLKSEELADTCRFYEDELRHQKYKRCLAMARWCDSEEKRLEAIATSFDSDKECWEYCSDYFVKWRQRWLELAENFRDKEA